MMNTPEQLAILNQEAEESLLKYLSRQLRESMEARTELCSNCNGDRQILMPEECGCCTYSVACSVCNPEDN